MNLTGRRLVESQTSIALAEHKPFTNSVKEDKYGRVPVVLPQLRSLENISTEYKAHILKEHALFALGEKYGLTKVLRWSPVFVRTLLMTILHPFTNSLHSQII